MMAKYRVTLKHDTQVFQRDVEAEKVRDAVAAALSEFFGDRDYQSFRATVEVVRFPE